LVVGLEPIFQAIEKMIEEINKEEINKEEINNNDRSDDEKG